MLLFDAFLLAVLLVILAYLGRIFLEFVFIDVEDRDGRYAGG